MFKVKIRKQTTQLENKQKIWSKKIWKISKENIKLANKNTERCLTLFVIMELKMKITRRYYYISIRISKIQKNPKTNTQKNKLKNPYKTKLLSDIAISILVIYPTKTYVIWKLTFIQKTAWGIL